MQTSSNLKQRLTTGLVLSSCFLLTIVYLQPRYFQYTVGILLIIAAWEWSYLVNVKRKMLALGYVLICLVLYASVLDMPSEYAGILLVVALLWWLLAASWLVLYERQYNVWWQNRLWLLFVGWLVLIPFAYSANYLKLLQREGAWSSPLLFIVIVVAAGDSAAYFGGKCLGRRQIAPRISPGKTGAGVVAQVTIAAAIGSMSPWFHVPVQPFVGALLAIVIIIVSIIGDLFESFIKRQVGCKDSSNLLPGHGGVLDRIDSHVSSMPLFAALLLFS